MPVMNFWAARSVVTAPWVARCVRWNQRLYHHTSNNLENLLKSENTRVLYQGFTGKAAARNAQAAIADGTKVVGDVTPRKGGRSHLGLAVFNTVSEAVKASQVDATFLHVPATSAFHAIEEAVEAEMPLIVAIAEYIPVHDMLRVREMLRAQKASRLVGPNCPGIITPGKYRIGIIPIEQCTQGTVDIVSRSSTMIYEASGATARAGPGQSLVIGLGGDMMPGTTMQEALDTLLTHDQSEAIILIGEIGVTSELDAANAIRRYRKTTVNPKPIISIVSGKRVPAGKDMGHTGALLSPSEQGAEAKALALEEAGAIVVPHLGMLDGTPQTLFL